MGRQFTRDFFLEVAKGNIAKHSTINKFGRNIEIDSGITADIWDGGHTLGSGGVSLIWTAPTAARTHTIASTSSDDVASGTGAKTIKIFGLTDWATTETSEELNMHTGGLTVTSNSYVIIHRMRVLTKGADDVNVGTITATAAVDATTTAQIRPGQGQTQMAVYGIPSIQKLYIGRLYANMNKGTGAAAGSIDNALCVNPEPETELTNFVVKHTFGLQLVGVSAFSIPYYVPKIIDGPAIIKVQSVSGGNNIDVSAGFDGVLVDN